MRALRAAPGPGAWKAVFWGACAAVFLFGGGAAHAAYTESNVQCPPGGVVGQTCKDNTNGYVTEGHCTHIYECKADKPPSSTPSATPEEKNPPPSFSPSEPLPAVPIYTYPRASSTAGSEILNGAYASGGAGAGETRARESDGSAAFDEIAYIASGGEMLRVGEPLTPAPRAASPVGAGTLGSVGGIGYAPSGQEAGNAAHNGESGDAAAPYGAAASFLPETRPSYGSAGFSETPGPAAAAGAFGAAAAALLFLLTYTYLRFRRRHPLLVEEYRPDPATFSKEVSTRDFSVANPIITGRQTPPIWENRNNPNSP